MVSDDKNALLSQCKPMAGSETNLRSQDFFSYAYIVKEAAVRWWTI